MQKLREFFSTVKKICEPIRSFKWQFGWHFLAVLIHETQPIIWLQITATIIAAIEKGNVEIFYNYLRYFGIFILILNIATWVSSRFGLKITIYLRTFLNKRGLDRFIRMDNNKIESYGTGRMNNIIFTGVNNWTNLLETTLISVVTNTIAIVYGLVVIAINVELPMFLFFLGLFIVSAVFIVMSFVKSHKFRKLAKEVDIILDRWKVKILMSKFEIFQNAKFKKEANYLDKITSKLFGIWWKHNKIKLTWQTGSSITIHAGRILLYLIIGLGVISGQYTISYLVLLTGLLGRIQGYIYQIRRNLKDITKGIVHVNKLRDVMEKIPLMEDDSKKDTFIFEEGNIQVNNISFGYNKKEQIFKNFSLDIKGGSKVAFVGESGSGKSTLIKLLAGYLHTDKGHVIVDGQSIKDVSLQSYYRHIGYLTQDPSVFDGTIMENLTYALKKRPAQAQLDKVIRASKCQFIYKYKDGLKTEIGERGVKLSGGQKQRLAIAKIMLKDPEIILLDEPTSALDSLSEQKISDALENLFKGRTVVVVAHRLQTVKEANEIVVFKNAKIIERGTHAGLVRKGGEYKKMLDLQTTF